MSCNALSTFPLDNTEVFSARAQQELESLAHQHGLSVDYYKQSYIGYPSLCEVSVSVNGSFYSAKHPNQDMALDMASSYALSDLRQRLAQRTLSSIPYSTHRDIMTPHYPPFPVTIPNQPGHGTHSSHHAATQKHYRMQLNNMANARGLLPVNYENETHTGPEHNPRWTSTVFVGGVKCGEGYGSSKGTARERAAQKALEYLTIRNYEYSGRLRLPS